MARNGVNSKIQGYAADITKLALKKIQRFSDINPGLFKLCGVVHDEILIMSRGDMVLDETKMKYENGVFSPSWKPKGNISEVIIHCKYLMEQSEAELFGGGWQGRSDFDVAPYWSH